VLSEGIPSISLRSQIDGAVRHIPILLDQAVGNFGWLDAPMPRVALYVIVALYCVVLARGIVVSSAGARIAMIALCLVTILVVIVLDVNYYSMLRSFGAQGRHIVPLLVIRCCALSGHREGTSCRYSSVYQSSLLARLLGNEIGRLLQAVFGDLSWSGQVWVHCVVTP